MDERKVNLSIWLYPVLLVIALAMLGWGIFIAATHPGVWTILAAGSLSVIGVALAWTLTVNAHSLARQNREHQQAVLSPLAERLDRMSAQLKQIGEQQLISERAKGIAFRESERDTFRRAIREDMSKKDWDAALKLANEIESLFGYKQEADRLRVEIVEQRDGEMRLRIGEVVAQIDRLCRGEQWTAAVRDAEQLLATYPNDAIVQRLPQDIESRRQNHKKELLDSWNDAVSRHDVDGSIEILKKLDLYLTPQEAAAVQETARQVFKDKLLLLGQRFTLAVKDRSWAEAIRVGGTIVKEYPNSRMAQEVRERMDVLKQRATETAETAA